MANTEKKSLTEVLKEAIQTSKDSRYAIAVGSGVDRAVLRRFMRGERDIKLETADKLAGFLHLELTSIRKAK